MKSTAIALLASLNAGLAWYNHLAGNAAWISAASAGAAVFAALSYFAALRSET